MFQFWVSGQKAKDLGCTHHARMFGIVPGFVTLEDIPMWVSRSDLLNPIEDVLGFLWVSLRQMRGEDPDIAISIGREIH